MDIDPAKEHHPFCNYFVQPREGCRQCETMWAKYPMPPGTTIEDVMKKHFPDVTPITAPTKNCPECGRHDGHFNNCNYLLRIEEVYRASLSFVSYTGDDLMQTLSRRAKLETAVNRQVEACKEAEVEK